jgi:hypothetical protein
LNVPKEGLSAGRVLVYKIIWFVAAIIAPEALVGMAAIEWLEARKISKIMAEIFLVRTWRRYIGVACCEPFSGIRYQSKAANWIC